jgi:hypothetical protein
MRGDFSSPAACAFSTAGSTPCCRSWSGAAAAPPWRGVKQELVVVLAGDVRDQQVAHPRRDRHGAPRPLRLRGAEHDAALAVLLPGAADVDPGRAGEQIDGTHGERGCLSPAQP